MRQLCYAVATALIVVSACRENAQQNTEEINYEGNTVTIIEDSPIISKLKTEVVSIKTFSSELPTVGTVQARPENYAEVGIPFDGRVVKSYARLGAKVRAGQTLFEISSPEFFEASKAYFQNVQNSKKAKAEYDRKKALLEHGIVSQRELEEAYAEAENALQEEESAESMLRVYGVDPANLRMGQSMGIGAPISGEIVDIDITTGSYIKADSEPLVTIADLSKVWVTALVKEHYIGSVTKGGKAEIFIESAPDDIIWGEIMNVGNLVDEETRSIQVVVSCDNADLKLKHGMYVGVHFISEPEEAILVPSTAVFQGDGSNFVYVCTEKGNVFERRMVSVGESTEGNTMISIRKGLEPGETIIAEGGLYLNN